MISKEVQHHPILEDSTSYFQRLQVSSQSLLDRDISQVPRTKIETRIQLLISLINNKNNLVWYPDDFEIVFSRLKTRLEKLLSVLPSDIEKEPDTNHKWSFLQPKSSASKLINFLLAQQPGVFSKKNIFAQIWDNLSFNDMIIRVRSWLQREGLFFKSLWWRDPFRNNYALYRTDKEFNDFKQEFSRKHWVNNS